MPETSALIGTVKIHTHTIFLAKFHLTDDNLLVAPTPAIEPAMT